MGQVDSFGRDYNEKKGGSMRELKDIMWNIDAIISMNPILKRRMEELEKQEVEDGGAVEVPLATGPVFRIIDVTWSEEEEEAYRDRHRS